MKKQFLALFITSMISFMAYGSNNYCAGIRGNGELVPAHWAALARIIEHKGLPSRVSGGSSAAITQFLLDGLSRNTFADTNSKKALLMKALTPHILYLSDIDAKSPRIMDIVADFTGKEKSGFFTKLKGSIKVARNLRTLKGILGEYGKLLNPELIYGLKKKFKFYKAQISEAIKMLGAFDAKNDQNIFYRKGIIDFKQLGIFFGRIADFTAGYGSVETNIKIVDFLDKCTDLSKGKTWKELEKAHPECQRSLYSALDEFYDFRKKKKRKRGFPNIMIFEKVGSGLKAYPTTAVVHGSGAKKYEKLSREYLKKRAKDFTQFVLNYDTELEYGYWGDEQGLEDIKVGLESKYPFDMKSSKFRKITNGTWFEVLATSPAEPGLSSLQKIPLSSTFNKKEMINRGLFKRWTNSKKPWKSLHENRDGIYSAGGWSDLHPTLVLKAIGCEDVIYITRQGGESVFGQQIFIRLTGYDDKIRFWEKIGEKNRIGYTDLNQEEEGSPWNKLYNLGNPDSSYNLSIKESTAIYCTNWDAFYIFKGEVTNAIDDAYSAPLFLKDESRRNEFNFGLNFQGKSKDGFPGCLQTIQ